MTKRYRDIHTNAIYELIVYNAFPKNGGKVMVRVVQTGEVQVMHADYFYNRVNRIDDMQSN